MDVAYLDSSTCLELALEGERLCKSRDFKSGVAFFEAALQSGTDDFVALSAIYSQLGNAYYYLGDYVKSVHFHTRDLSLAREMADKNGESKASGNLGNALKAVGRFDEAIMCCRRHLDLTTQLEDQVGKAKALYNLGNAYHAKGKHVGREGRDDPGEFPEEVKACLVKALELYRQNLEMTRNMGDKVGEGRACGNLGNVHYLLGDFGEAITFHEMRLEIAKEFNDKNAQRRAYTNLGNAHIFSGNFENAASHYKKSLLLAQEVGDQAVEAQACYSLGNTYTLLRDYSKAIEYHLRHLQIAQQLQDKIGEARAFWSLGNAHSALGEHRKALLYAKRHLEISEELGDEPAQKTASMNMADLKKVLGLGSTEDIEEDEEERDERKLRRKSMEEMNLIRMTPEAQQATSRGKRSMSVGQVVTKKSSVALAKSLEEEDDGEEDAFFDLLSRCQGERMDDQRCVMPKNPPIGSLQQRSLLSQPTGPKKKTVRANSVPTTGGEGTSDDLLDLIVSMQSKRMDEQRATLPETEEDEEPFFEMLLRSQSTRLEDQRSSLPSTQAAKQRGPTVPDDDIFSLITRLQQGRMDDQRADIKDKNKNNVVN